MNTSLPTLSCRFCSILKVIDACSIAGKPKSAVKDLEEGWNEKLASDSEAAVRWSHPSEQAIALGVSDAEFICSVRCFDVLFCALQVKAERHHDDDESIEELQKKSVHHIRTEHHEEEHVVESASQEKDDLKKGKANPVHA